MNDQVLREQLITLLEGGSAHLPFRDAVNNFPVERINDRVSTIPYSAWELIEHMRIAQYDILDFIKNPDYVEPEWPKEYWPPRGQKANQDTWDQSIRRLQDDLEDVKSLVTNPRIDLTDALPYAPNYTYIRQILLVADHNAYHIGQIISLRRALNIY